MPFNYDTLAAARQAGYSDEDIYSHLSQSDTRFKTAQESGYTLDQVADHFTPKTEDTQKDIPQIKATPEEGMLSHAARAVREYLSPILGPTEEQKFREAVPVQTDKGTEYQYKPYANDLVREGLLSSEGGILGGKAVGALPRIPQQKGTAAQIGAGIVNSLEGIPEFMGSRMGAAMAVMAPFKALQRVASAGFGADMLSSVPQQYKAFKDAKTVQDKTTSLLNLGSAILFGSTAAAHASGVELPKLGDQTAKQIIENTPTDTLQIAANDPEFRKTWQYNPKLMDQELQKREGSDLSQQAKANDLPLTAEQIPKGGEQNEQLGKSETGDDRQRGRVSDEQNGLRTQETDSGTRTQRTTEDRGSGGKEENAGELLVPPTPEGGETREEDEKNQADQSIQAEQRGSVQEAGQQAGPGQVTQQPPAVQPEGGTALSLTINEGEQNATQEGQKQEGVQQQRASGSESGQAAEAGGSDRVLNAAQGQEAPKVVAATYTDPNTGQVFEGKNHIEAASKAGVTAPEERTARETPEYGFKTSDGNYISREQAAKVAIQADQIKEQPERGQLHSDQLTFGFDESKSPTSLRNKVVDQERIERGLPAAFTEGKRDFGQVWEDATKAIDQNPAYPHELVKSLKEKPREISDKENAVLLHHQIDLQNEYDKAINASVKAYSEGNEGLAEENRIRSSYLSDQLLDLYNVGKKVGTETARGLNARKMLANEDFSLARMMTERRAALGGEKLTPEQEEEVKKLHDKIQETQKNFDDYTKKKTPSQESLLKGYKTRLKRRTAELESKLETGDLSVPERRKLALDDEALRLKAENERAKESFARALYKDRQKQRTPLEKVQDTLVKWRRAFILSSPVTLAKLTSAAGERMMFTPAEELVGAGISKLIPEVAKRAPREGGLNARSEAKAITEGFTKGMKDAWKVLTTGKSDLDALYGKKNVVPNEAVDFMGNIHGALKTVAKRNEFSRSFEKRMSHAIANGVDVSDPLVQTSIATSAYKDAQRSIFMQDNRVVGMYKRALSALDQPDKETGRIPVSSKVGGTALRVLLPIVKVPTNIVAETLQYATGLVTGSARLAFAMRRGIENLKPGEADLIMRDLKKGSLGAAALTLGYLNPNTFGGYYQPGQKRKEGDAKVGAVKLYGHNIPSYLVHNPLLEALQIGATIRRVSDSKLRRTDTEKQGLGMGILAASIGLAEEVPFVNQMDQVAKVFTPQQRSEYFGELGKSLFVPSLVQFAAQQQDKNTKGEVNKRYPKTILQGIETGIPVLRKKVPLSRNAR